MQELLKLLKGEENLTQRENNIYLWVEFFGEEEDLTDKEKEAWEVRR